MEHIFKEIVHIMHHDYAGFEDKSGWDNPVYFLCQIQRLKESNLLTREKFVEIIKDYLSDFNDQHIYIYDHDSSVNKQSRDRGFHVRRYKEYLYVTQVNSENRLKKGMFFKTLGGYTIPELREKHSRLLNENHAERENWMPVLSLYEYGEIEDNEGITSILKFNFYEKKNMFQPILLKK